MFQIALSAALAVALSMSTAAQAAAAPDPAQPTASAPDPRYDSAFAGYRPYREAPPADWRALNAEVGAIGGHVGIFRAPSKADPAVPRPAVPAAHAH